jgi:hypothetical protein
MSDTPLTAVALVCTLTPSPSESSSELLAEQVLAQLVRYNVTGSTIRVVDHDIRPGVELDMGNGDAWPSIRAQIAAADILLVSTPTWMGQHSSLCMRVLERLSAELSQKERLGPAGDLRQGGHCRRFRGPADYARCGRIDHGDAGGQRSAPGEDLESGALPTDSSRVTGR